MTQKKACQRHSAVKGYPIYRILFAYLLLGWFWPVTGLIALACMLAPVALSVKRGELWCDRLCPRGNMFDRLLSRYSPHKPIPRFVNTFRFHLLMVILIFLAFGVLMYFAWGDWNAIGKVFWWMVLITTIVGVILAFIYSPRTWCNFCPMGTLAGWTKPKDKRLPQRQECHVREL